MINKNKIKIQVRVADGDTDITPYQLFQKWLDNCPVETINYLDFGETFEITFKVPLE